MVKAIVQARMNSTRLPGKILKEVLGKPMLLHLIERLKFSKHIDDVIIATTENKNDDILTYFCLEHDISFYRGSETDVLERHYKTANYFNIDPIVRVTSDCPLIDYEVVDKVISCFFEGSNDFASNINPPTYPDGLDAYVFSFNALKKANERSKNPYEREHVTPYFWNHPEIFKIMNVFNSSDLSKIHRWTLDYKEDYNFIKTVYEALYLKKKDFNMQDILKLLQEKPEIKKINEHLIEHNSFK